MKPHAEMVHWLFAAGILFIGLCLLCEAVVGREVWQVRPWRKYLWPGVAFALGVLLWPVMAFFTNSAIHMYAHGSWAEVLMLAGGAELGLVHGRLKSPYWRLTWPLAFVVTGTAFIVHEQNPWFFARSAFLHHLLGWTFIVAAVVPARARLAPALDRAAPLLRADDRRVAIQLFSDRDVAPIFGHLSPLAGEPHR